MTYREFKIKFGFAPQVTEKQAAPAQPPARLRKGEAPEETSQPADAEAPAPAQPPAKKR